MKLLSIHNKIMIKTGSEIQLKSDPVRRKFMSTLKNNVLYKVRLEDIDCKLKSGAGRIYLETKDAMDKFISPLKKVFGVHAISYIYSDSYETKIGLEEKVLDYAKLVLSSGQSFAVRVRREGNQEFSSKDAEFFLGSKIMTNIDGLKVNLTKPDVKIRVEIKKNDFIVYHEEIPGLKGLPLSVEGHVFVLPAKDYEALELACFLMLRRGSSLVFLENMKEDLNLILPYLNESVKFYSTDKEFSNDMLEEIKRKYKFDIQAVVTADEALDEVSLQEYADFDNKVDLVTLRPLLGLPKEIRKRYLDAMKEE